MIRFGVSMDAGLLARFDELIDRTGGGNRSEAVRDLVRARLQEDQVSDPNARVLGVLTLVYDHHQRELQDKLVALQHEHLDAVVSTLHVHASHDSCLEVLLLKGRAGTLRDFASALSSFRGVHHSHFMLTAVSHDPEHEHDHE